MAVCGRAGPLPYFQGGSSPVVWDPGRDRFRSWSSWRVFLHIWSRVLPPGASGSCVIGCSCWQHSLPSSCGGTDVWASGINPGATSGCLVDRGWSPGPWRGLGGYLCSPPQAAVPQAHIYPDDTDISIENIHATYSSMDASVQNLTPHMHTAKQTCTRTHHAHLPAVTQPHPDSMDTLPPRSSFRTGLSK